MSNDLISNDLISIEEAAKILGVSNMGVYRRIKANKLKVYYRDTPRASRVSRQEVEALKQFQPKVE